MDQDKLRQRIRDAGYRIHQQLDEDPSVTPDPLDGPPTSLEGMRRIGALGPLDHLHLRSPTPAALAEGVRGIQRVRYLHIDGARIEAPGLAAIASQTDLERLSFCRCLLGPGALRYLQGSPRLMQLELSGGTDVQGPELEQLRDVVSLRKIELSQHNPLEDDGQALAGLEQLNDIALWHGTSCDAVVARIADMPRLEWLHLVDGTATDRSVEALGRSRSIRRLALLRNRFTDDLYAHAGRLLGLQALTVQGEGLKGSGLDRLAGLRDLRKFDSPYSEPDLMPLEPFPLLERVWLVRPTKRALRLPPGGLRPLGGKVHLEELALYSIAPQQQDLGLLGGLVRLRELRLELDPLDVTGTSHLARLRSLVSLDLVAPGLGDAALAPLARLDRLQWLTLDNSRVTGAGLAQLGPLASLSCLMVNDCPVGDEAVQPILQFPSLSCVHIVGHRMSPLAFQRLELARPDLWVDPDLGF